RHTQAADPGRTAGPFGEREDGYVPGSVEQAGGLGRVFHDPEARGLRGKLEGEAGLDRHLIGRREAGKQLAKLEMVEDAARLVVVVAGPARPLELQLDRHVADDRDHPLATPDLFGIVLDLGFLSDLERLYDFDGEATGE